jgi:PAS domain S-box-containing protein
MGGNIMKPKARSIRRKRRIKTSDGDRDSDLIGMAVENFQPILDVFSGEGGTSDQKSSVQNNFEFRRNDMSPTDLEQAIDRYVRLFEFAPIPYVTFDRAGRITGLNLAAVSLLGRSRNLLLGCPFSVMVIRDDTHLFLDHLLRCRSSESVVQTELRLKTAGEGTIYGHLSSTPHTLWTEGAQQYQTAIVDLTERRQAELVLRRSEERITADLQAMNLINEVGNICVDPRATFEQVLTKALECAVVITAADKGIIHLLDPATETLNLIVQHGCNGKLLGLFENISPKEANKWGAALRTGNRVVVEDVARNGVFTRHMTRKVLLEAGVRAVQSTPLISKNGTVLGLISTYFDKTRQLEDRERRLMDLLARQMGDYIDRTRQERALLDSEMELRAKKGELDLVMRQTPFMLTRCSRDYRYRYVSAAYAKLVGSTPEKIAGKSSVEVMGRKGFNVIRPYVQKVLSGERVEYEKWIPLPNGPRYLHVTYSPERDVNGNVVGWIASLLDISARKKAEESLAEAIRHQEALYEFVRRRHDAKSLPEIYKAALDAICATLNCDRTSILLFDDQEAMRFVAWRGLSRTYRKKVEGHSPWKRTDKKPQPIRIGNIMQAELPKALKAAILAEGIQAAAFFPLIGEGRLIGKFMTYYDQPHDFTEEENTLALNIAGQLALAIERKRSEAALLRSEEVHRAFFSQTEVGMTRSDLNGRIAFVNQKLCELVGYSESELIGKTFIDLSGPEHRKETRRLFRDLVRYGRPYHIEKRYLRKDGSSVWVNVTASPVRDANGKTRAAVAVVSDITERKQAQEALETVNRLLEVRVEERTRDLVRTNERLQAEASRRKQVEGEILEISEREQRHIGQELHDSVCQHLTAIAFMTRSVAMRLKTHRVVDVSDLEKIADLINEGVTETRTIARGLHPVEMNPDGLAAALQTLLHRRSQIPYRLEIEDDVPIPDATVALHLYRIASEAVINANKHARAREVTVRMRSLPEEIELSVTDDGVGLLKKREEGGGMGFHVMDYRARSIGARLEVSSIKPHGTRVACYLPRR